MTAAELDGFCRDDIARLLWQARGSDPHAVPADILGDICDVLDVTCTERWLPRYVLGCCHFERRVVYINSRLQEISLPRTNIRGLRNSTLAHELAHLRFPEHRDSDMTLPLFEIPALPAVCPRNWERGGGLSRTQRARERQADVYASLLLVPGALLAAHPTAVRVAGAAAERAAIASEDLWLWTLQLADHFHVTGALMARRLVEMGWLLRRERHLAVATAAAQVADLP
jgi:hypothetical protein